MSRPLIEGKQICKKFGEVQALGGVSFSLNSGEILGLVGDNGAGKSTLIKILTGIFPPDKGEVFFEGERVKFSSARDARDHGIETIYQEHAVADELSVMRNIFLGKEPKKFVGFLKLLDLGHMKKESKKIMENLGFGISSMDQEVKYCSGGERQGIAIARALYFEAKLVILDEPTRELGVKEAKHVLDLALELKKKGTSCIFITHSPQDVYRIADRFLVLIRGEKVADVYKKDISMRKLTKLMRG